MSVRYALGCAAVMIWLTTIACTSSVPARYLPYPLTNETFEDPVVHNQMEFEIQFAREADNPGLDKFHVHIRCSAAWEFERGDMSSTACGASERLEGQKPALV